MCHFRQTVRATLPAVSFTAVKVSDIDHWDSVVSCRDTAQLSRVEHDEVAGRVSPQPAALDPAVLDSCNPYRPSRSPAERRQRFRAFLGNVAGEIDDVASDSGYPMPFDRVVALAQHEVLNMLVRDMARDRRAGQAPPDWTSARCGARRALRSFGAGDDGLVDVAARAFGSRGARREHAPGLIARQATQTHRANTPALAGPSHERDGSV